MASSHLKPIAKERHTIAVHSMSWFWKLHHVACFFAANPNMRRSPPGKKWQDGWVLFHRTQHSHSMHSWECLGRTVCTPTIPSSPGCCSLKLEKQNVTNINSGASHTSKNLPCNYSNYVQRATRPLAHFRGSFQPPSGCQMHRKQNSYATQGLSVQGFHTT